MYIYIYICSSKLLFTLGVHMIILQLYFRLCYSILAKYWSPNKSSTSLYFINSYNELKNSLLGFDISVLIFGWTSFYILYKYYTVLTINTHENNATPFCYAGRNIWILVLGKLRILCIYSINNMIYTYLLHT